MFAASMSVRIPAGFISFMQKIAVVTPPMTAVGK